MQHLYGLLTCCLCGFFEINFVIYRYHKHIVSAAFADCRDSLVHACVVKTQLVCYLSCIHKVIALVCACLIWNLHCFQYSYCICLCFFFSHYTIFPPISLRYIPYPSFDSFIFFYSTTIAIHKRLQLEKLICHIFMQLPHFTDCPHSYRHFCMLPQRTAPANLSVCCLSFCPHTHHRRKAPCPSRHLS